MMAMKDWVRDWAQANVTATLAPGSTTSKTRQYASNLPAITGSLRFLAMASACFGLVTKIRYDNAEVWAQHPR